MSSWDGVWPKFWICASVACRGGKRLSRPVHHWGWGGADTCPRERPHLSPEKGPGSAPGPLWAAGRPRVSVGSRPCAPPNARLRTQPPSPRRRCGPACQRPPVCAGGTGTPSPQTAPRATQGASCSRQRGRRRQKEHGDFCEMTKYVTLALQKQMPAPLCCLKMDPGMQFAVGSLPLPSSRSSAEPQPQAGGVPPRPVHAAARSHGVSCRCEDKQPQTSDHLDGETRVLCECTSKRQLSKRTKRLVYM